MDEKKIKAIVDSNLGIVSEIVPDSPIFGYKDELRNLMVHCIKRGVELAFEDLWHPAEEEPEIFKLLVCVKEDSTVYPTTLLPSFDWKHEVRDKGITGWLYFDDLLGQKGVKL